MRLSGMRLRKGRGRKDWGHLRVVRPRRPRKFPFLFFSLVTIGMLVVGIVSLQAIVSQNSFRMEELARRTRALEQDYGRLKLNVAQLASPERIATEAHAMGLRLPGEVHTVTVPRDRMPMTDRPVGSPSFAIKALLGAKT